MQLKIWDFMDYLYYSNGSTLKSHHQCRNLVVETKLCKCFKQFYTVLIVFYLENASYLQMFLMFSIPKSKYWIFDIKFWRKIKLFTILKT